MIYLLDTDILVALTRGLKSPRQPAKRRAESLKRRLQETQAHGDIIAVSAVTVSELEHGARRSRDYAAEIAAVNLVLSPFEIMDYDGVEGPLHYGLIRHELEWQGISIGAMDLLIAAHARAIDAAIVTNNTAHFQRVRDLRVENWLDPKSNGSHS